MFDLFQNISPIKPLILRNKEPFWRVKPLLLHVFSFWPRICKMIITLQLDLYYDRRSFIHSLKSRNANILQVRCISCIWVLNKAVVDKAWCKLTNLRINELSVLNSRTVGTEVPKRRYRSPERSLKPTPETSRSRIVGLPKLTNRASVLVLVFLIIPNNTFFSW